MAYTTRASSFLPTIKCSSCAQDIEISRMGDHVCGDSGEFTPPPDSSFEELSYRRKPSDGSGFLKPGRAVPPKVDTSAANRPYFRQGQLTPMSASPRSQSPSISDGQRSPLGRPPRSSTDPTNSRPHSPDTLSPNMDSAYPPYGTAMEPQQKGGYGGFGNQYKEADSMYTPVSPRTATDSGLLQRMGNILPGPFHLGGSQRMDSPSETGHQRNPTTGSLTELGKSPSISMSYDQRSSTAAGHSRTSTTSSNGGLPRAPRLGGYGGFGRPSMADDSLQEPPRSATRASTFPLQNESQEGNLRRPSEPGNRGRRPSIESIRGRKKLSGPDLSRPPPRSTSLRRLRIDTQGDEVPPVPPNLAEEFGIGNPYHTPTDSQSSNTSGLSEHSKVSSRSSPPTSNASPSKRNLSAGTRIDNLTAGIQSSINEIHPKGLPPISTYHNQWPIKSQLAASLTTPPLSPLPPSSPTSPAVQSGLRIPSPDSHSLPSRNPARITTPTAPSSTSSSPPKNRPQTAKHICRGCAEPIKGRSVSSADGRLSGRYHKACFVCTTCRSPFATSEFYVIKDRPYCERHYHELNGSLCAVCDSGIEGVYLHGEGEEKFHERCLRCADCGRGLRNGYFEVMGQGGGVFCERDAWRRMRELEMGRGRGGGPGRGGRLGASPMTKMERRTTRLMIM